MNGNKIKEANNHRKKLSLNGVRSEICATFPAKKLPDQKKEDPVSKIIAKIKFFGIYLSTSFIRDEVSNRLPSCF